MGRIRTPMQNRGFDADLSRRTPFCPTFPSPAESGIRPRRLRQRPKVGAIFRRLPRSTARDARSKRGLRPDARSVGEWHDRGYIPPYQASSLLQQPCSSLSLTVNEDRTVPKESRSMPLRPLLSVCLSAIRAVGPRTTTDGLRRLFPAPAIPNFALTGRRGSEWQTQSPPHIQFGGKTHPSIRDAASLVPFP